MLTLRKSISIVLCILMIGYFDTCIAGKSVKEVAINCSPTPKEAEWVIYDGDPKTRMTLTTIGMEMPGKKGLVRRWYEQGDAYGHSYRSVHTEDVVDNVVVSHDITNIHTEFASDLLNGSVIAECIGSGSVRWMYDSPKKNPSLVCPKGDGIKILFSKPNDNDTKKFVYHAILTINQDEDQGDKGQKNVMQANNESVKLLDNNTQYCSQYAETGANKLDLNFNY
jgi:hypothetical protein